jgi:mRNA interferase MazF
VVLVLFPNADLVSAKRRPALVVQADEPPTGLEQVIVAMITSNLSRDRHPARVRVDKDSHDGKSSGLLADSVIMTDNLATVRLVEIDKALGVLPRMDAVDNALKVTFGLS